MTDTTETLGIIAAISQDCEQITDLIEDLTLAGQLAQAVEQFATSSNPYVTAALAFFVAQSERTEAEHLLVFDLIQGLNVNDENTLTNLLTALKRLDQMGVAWRTPEREALVERLLGRCRAFGQALHEYADDYVTMVQ